MEKFRKFGDEATGYNPFLKHPFAKASGTTKILYFVGWRYQTLGLVLLALRLSLLLILALAYAVLSVLGSVSWIYEFGLSPLKALAQTLLTRPILFCFGFTSITQEIERIQ